MISSEKELEDYICNHQEEFIEKLKKIYNVKNIEFVGRQIRIGNDSIADLVYIMKPNEEYPIKELIIVELKYRELFCKDLSQIMRYITKIKEKDEYINFEDVNGCFVSFGCSDEMMDISKELEEKIKFISLECKLDFKEEKYRYSDEYLKEIELDERLKKYMIDDSEVV